MQYSVLSTRKLRGAQEALLPGSGEQRDESTATRDTVAATRPVDLRSVWHQVRLNGQSRGPPSLLLSKATRNPGSSFAMSQVQGVHPMFHMQITGSQNNSRCLMISRLSSRMKH